MKILAIETSCDETAVCIIDATGTPWEGGAPFKTLGNALHSQIETHRPYGGVFPNLAKREHAKNLVPIVSSALKDAGLLQTNTNPSVSKTQLDTIKELLAREPELFAHLLIFFAQHQKPEIDAIAVTVGPGLEPALWGGVNFARALSFAWNLPVVPVNHMEGHIVMSAVDENDTIAPIAFPGVALLISGGHTELVRMQDWFHYKKIGQTRDDAVGEAYDKVARLLGLPYPGGPEISKLATEAREKNIPSPFPLPRGMIHSPDLDFSFSGLKTAVRVALQKHGAVSAEDARGIAREFENSVADVFITKVRKAITQESAKTVIVGGGVAANKWLIQKLRDMVTAEFPSTSCKVCPPKNATDNALMIAVAGYVRATKEPLGSSYAKPDSLRANGNFSLDESSEVGI